MHVCIILICHFRRSCTHLGFFVDVGAYCVLILDLLHVYMTVYNRN